MSADRVRAAPTPIKRQLQSAHGLEDLQILVVGALLQLNAFMPFNGGPGFFLVFPSDYPVENAIATAKALLDGEPLPVNENITWRVPGAITAGTIAREFSVKFGIPTVSHAPKK